MTRQEAINKIQNIINTAERFRTSYFWGRQGNAASRRAYEKKNSIEEFEWTDGKDVYTAAYSVECSCNHVYAKGHYTKNGKKTTLTAIKNSLVRLQAQA